MSTINRRSESREDGGEELDNLGLTVTRRTWPTRRNEIPKYIMSTEDTNNNNSKSYSSNVSNNTLMDVGGLTMTTTTNLSSTPSRQSEDAWISPISADINNNNNNNFSYQEQIISRRRTRDTSTDLIWCEEEEKEAEINKKDKNKEKGKDPQVMIITNNNINNNETPLTVLTQRPPRALTVTNSSVTPSSVRRRLSMNYNEIARPSINSINSPLPFLTNTPSPIIQMRELIQNADPATESREVPLRPGYTIPSPRTPLWVALEEEVEETDNENENNEEFISQQQQQQQEKEKEDQEEECEGGVIVRLSLNRRPSSFTHRVASSLSPVSVANSTSANMEPTQQWQLSQDQQRQTSNTSIMQDNVPLSASSNYNNNNINMSISTIGNRGSQRRVEDAQRRAKADDWAERTRKFFELIDQRPLLTITVDE